METPQLPPPITHADLASLPPLKEPSRPRYKGLPRKGTGIDFPKVREDFMSAPERDWNSYCQARGYRPAQKMIPWRRWNREKAYRAAFQGISEELEREGTRLGPELLLQRVKAVKRIPETAAAMLSLIQHAIRVHLDEARHDEQWLKQKREGRTVPRETLIFSLDPAGTAMLAGALKTTAELLQKSLGIDVTEGMTTEKWAQLVDEEISKHDGSEALSEMGKNPVQVEIMGAASVQDAMKEVFERWMDKPGAEQSLPVGTDDSQPG